MVTPLANANQPEQSPGMGLRGVGRGPSDPDVFHILRGDDTGGILVSRWGKDISLQLMELRQGSDSAVDYAIKFRTLAAQSGWNDVALWAVFCEGLSPALQTELACREDATSLSQHVATAIRLDNLLRQHRAGARPSVLSRPRLHPDYPRPREEAPEPMQLGRSRLTEQEHQRRIQMRLCYYCGGSGHLIHRCPEKPSSAQVALIDSGAAVNLIDRVLVEELQIPTIPCMPSLRITAIDSQPIGGGYLTHQTELLDFKVGLFHRERLAFYVTSSPTNPVILGFLPSGLTNAPAVFQSLINEVFQDILGKWVIAYIDDILVYLTSLEEHVCHVRDVLSRLQQNHLYVKPEKFEFHRTTITFLGYVILWQGVEMDLTKVHVVTEWPNPTTIKELQRFLGFANFYRRFIWNYSSVAGPLTSLLRGKPRRLSWSDQAQMAFVKLKDSFTTAPILRHPDSDLPFMVEAQWALFFTRFEFSVTYRPGTKNSKADALSRLFQAQSEPSQPDLILPAAAILAPVRWSLLEEIQRACADKPPPANCPSTKVYVPLQFRQQVLQWVHEAPSSGHPGIIRSTQLTERRFWWPSFRTDVERFVRSCSTCVSRQLPEVLLEPLPTPQHPWSHLSVDFLTNLPNSGGFTTMMVVVDRFSKAFHLQVWRSLCEWLSINVSLSSGYDPQSNGQVAPLNQEIGRFLRSYCSREQQHWSEFLPWAEYAQNSLIHSSTGLMLFQCVLGYQPPLFPWSGEPSDVPAVEEWSCLSQEVWERTHVRLQRAVRRERIQANQRHRPHPPYRVGQRAWLSTRNLKLKLPCLKLSPKFIGPFEIVCQVIIYQGGQVFSLANRMNNRVGFVSTMPSTSASILINNTQLADTGTYQCLVNNLPDRGERNIGVIGLTVLVPPSLPVCRIQGSLDVGSDVTLLCGSEEGIPTPTYLWEKLDSMPKLPLGAMQDQMQGMVSLKNISVGTSGVYQCTASNAIGTSTCQLNVQVVTRKGRELADMMERRKVDILCVQETRWKGSKARSIGAGFKLFYYGVDSKRNGVGVVLKEEFVRNVLEVKRVSDRVMSLKLKTEGVMLNVVSGYAPQVGCELEEKERFWSELDEVMESIPTGERVVIGAGFNGHVGEGNRGDEEVMDKFGVKERNLEGQMVVDFAKRMDMAEVNTYFQKREEHRVTYKSGGRRTQVDYILFRRGNLKEIGDCKVVVGESVARQHWMVVCRITLMVCKKKRSKIEIEKKTKWWKLKKEECCEEFRQKLRQALGGQVVLPDNWEATAEVIRETGRKVLGVSSGRRKEDKETWWWNEEVQDSIQKKRLAKKKWDMDRTEENRQEYKELQRRVKREVSKAKQKAYDELYTRLDTREGQKDLYRLARQRDRDGKDVQQVRVIKDRDGRVLTNLEKAYDRVPREELWYCMRKSGVAEYVRVVQDMYEKSRTVVRCAVGQTEEFKVEVGLHQGSALSSFLFAIVMDQLSEEVRQESPWTMMFADDIVICSESREQVEENLERWRFALERRGMKVSRSKTEYMCVNEREGSGTVRLQGEEVKKVQEFKYLGSTVQSNGECGKEVKKRVHAAQPQSVGLIAGTIVSGILAAVIFALLVVVTLFYWRNKNRYEDDDIPNEIREDDLPPKRSSSVKAFQADASSSENDTLTSTNTYNSRYWHNAKANYDANSYTRYDGQSFTTGGGTVAGGGIGYANGGHTLPAPKTLVVTASSAPIVTRSNGSLSQRAPPTTPPPTSGSAHTHLPSRTHSYAVSQAALERMGAVPVMVPAQTRAGSLV
ncbi:hypothetical protein QTP86_030628 [Hemibagrus guttatus]|nr:hypothetical protein QTP86_030628 [Hemibagrus guttatus]